MEAVSGTGELEPAGPPGVPGAAHSGGSAAASVEEAASVAEGEAEAEGGDVSPTATAAGFARNS